MNAFKCERALGRARRATPRHATPHATKQTDYGVNIHARCVSNGNAIMLINTLCGGVNVTIVAHGSENTWLRHAHHSTLRSTLRSLAGDQPFILPVSAHLLSHFNTVDLIVCLHSHFLALPPFY